MGGPSIKISNPRPKALIPNAPYEGLEHFGIQTDNMEKAMAELTAKGTKFVQGITQIDPKMRVSFFVSPENILVELMEVKK